MWLLTTVGFSSVVMKPGDTELTIRARARSDLEALKRTYLPTMGPVFAGGGTDYPFRARIGREVLAQAVSQMVRDIDYANFKNEVAVRQGKDRARTYSEVWRVLHEIQEGAEA